MSFLHKKSNPCGNFGLFVFHQYFFNSPYKGDMKILLGITACENGRIKEARRIHFLRYSLRQISTNRASL